MSDSNTKLYYNIREVAEMMQLPEHTLRFWEKEFPSLNPKKSSGGTRQYTQQDIDLVRLIHHLVKEQGLTIKAARARLGLRTSFRPRAQSCSGHPCRRG